MEFQSAAGKASRLDRALKADMESGLAKGC